MSSQEAGGEIGLKPLDLRRIRENEVAVQPWPHGRPTSVSRRPDTLLKCTIEAARERPTVPRQPAEVPITTRIRHLLGAPAAHGAPPKPFCCTVVVDPSPDKLVRPNQMARGR
jgi:hypothetical protein